MNERKLSEIVLELAQRILRNPGPPSSAAAHAALLLVHVAWNRCLGEEMPAAAYERILEKFEEDGPNLWSEMRSRDPEKLIGIVTREKQARFPQDRRLIKVCGMRKGNVHVEWIDGGGRQDIERETGERLERFIELALSGDDKAAIKYLRRTTGLSTREAKQWVDKVRRVVVPPG